MTTRLYGIHNWAFIHAIQLQSGFRKVDCPKTKQFSLKVFLH